MAGLKKVTGVVICFVFIAIAFNNCSKVNFDTASSSGQVENASTDPTGMGDLNPDPLNMPDTNNNNVPDDIDVPTASFPHSTPPPSVSPTPTSMSCAQTPVPQKQIGTDSTGKPICQPLCSQLKYSTSTKCTQAGWTVDPGSGWGIGQMWCGPGYRNNSAQYTADVAKYGFKDCRKIYDHSGDEFYACLSGFYEKDQTMQCVADAKATLMALPCAPGTAKVGYQTDGTPNCKPVCPANSCASTSGWSFDSSGRSWGAGIPICVASYRNDDTRFIQDARNAGMFSCSIYIDGSGDRAYYCGRGFTDLYPNPGDCATASMIIN